MAAANSQSAPRILGLTGPIGCGKSTVGSILLELGAADRIDADRVVHDLMAPGTDTTRAVAAAFGDQLLRPDGGIDRVRLGRIVFGDHTALRRLESITHPAVRQEIRARLGRYGACDVVVVDAVKLLQSELLPLVDAVWVVQCSPVIELRRLAEMRGMSEEEGRARVDAMPSFESERVTRVIENSDSLDGLRIRVEEAWRAFLADVGIDPQSGVG